MLKCQCMKLAVMVELADMPQTMSIQMTAASAEYISLNDEEVSERMYQS